MGDLKQLQAFRMTLEGKDYLVQMDFVGSGYQAFLADLCVKSARLQLLKCRSVSFSWSLPSPVHDFWDSKLSRVFLKIHAPRGSWEQVSEDPWGEMTSTPMAWASPQFPSLP